MAKVKGNVALADQPLEFEDVPDRQVKKLPSIINDFPPPVRIRKVRIKMAKDVKAPKMKPYAPSRVEVMKTVIIAVLLTSVIAFVSGMNFQKGQTAEVQNAVHAAQSVKK